MTRRFWANNTKLALLALVNTLVAAAPSFGIGLSAQQATDTMLVANAFIGFLFLLFAYDEEVERHNGNNHQPPEPPKG